MNKQVINKLVRYSAAAWAGVFSLSSAHADVIWQSDLDSFVPRSLNSNGNSIDQFRLDIDGNGSRDLTLRAGPVSGNEAILAIDRANSTGWIVNPFSSDYIEGFATNQIIDASSLNRDEDPNRTGDDIIVRWNGNYLENDFSAQGYDYLGVEFINGGNTHYGWIGVSFNTDGLGDVEMLVTGYAWNDSPNEGILAGATSNAVPEPSTYALGLGLLALGAAGVRARRQARKS